jgi:hypothetical protein
VSGRRQSTEDLYLFEVFQGAPDRPLALPAPSTVDNDERAFLTEVAVSALLELQDERRQDAEKRKS